MSTVPQLYQPVPSGGGSPKKQPVHEDDIEGNEEADGLKGEKSSTVTPLEKQDEAHHAATLLANKMKILIVVISYFVVSMSMVFLNKTLLTEGSSIPAPLFVTWYQCVVTAAIVAALGELGKRSAKGTFFAQFPPFEYDIKIAQRVLPLSLVLVSMIALNNLCLQYVEVTFYQIARGLTTVFNVVLSYLFLGESTSAKALFCCSLIIAGFYIGVENEVRFTLIGTAFGVASSLFVCLNALYTKKINQVVEGNQWRLALYNNLNATFLFPPIIILAGEHAVLVDHFDYLVSPAYWTMMTVTGLFGFLIGILTVFQITLTSPLTHNIAGTAKATLQTLLALLIYQNPVTWKGGMGILFVLLGSAFYTAVRNAEMNAMKNSTK
jgi:GDP-fucose transporter C1